MKDTLTRILIGLTDRVRAVRPRAPAKLVPACLVLQIALTGAWASAQSSGPEPAGCPEESAVAMTRQGCVRGDIVEGAAVFKGIPFASPPLGDLRWRGPAAPAVRGSILEARNFSARCMQPPSLTSPAPISEDCLYLNIWAPAPVPAGTPLPVMVFIHGGGNTSGSASQTPGQDPRAFLDQTPLYLYDGQELARRGGVIVVTLQYRLNVFGYLVHPALAAESEHSASGNYGLLDQIAALRWVKDNIGSFGGDPSRVLLFGESGGGSDVCALVASPLAAGLFASAIMESGGCEARSSAEMQAWSNGLAASAGCSGAADAIGCLRQRDARSLLEGFDLTAVEPGGRIVAMPGPTVDGYVLPLSPVDALRTGEHNHIPFVIGVNAQETSSPIFRIPPGLTPAQYEERVRALFPAHAGSVLRLYPAADYASPRFALVALTTDYQFICPARRYLEFAARAQQEPVYGYLYTNIMEGGPVRRLGAAHGLELYYIFQAMDRLGPGYRPTESDRRLERIMLDYWTQFAATGDPNGGGLPPWTRFYPSRGNYLDLSPTPRRAAPLGADRCDLLTSLAMPGRVH